MNLFVALVVAMISIVCIVIIWYVYNDRCVVVKRYALPYGIVEIVQQSCQEGLPHTWSPSIIRMTETDWESSRRDDILRHERVHLRQRQDPKTWRDFYRSAWGYEYTMSPPPGLPKHWIERLRPNPDTADGPWAIWRDRYVFFPTFRDATRSLRTALVQVWDNRTQQMVEPPPEWRQMFCHGGNCPHQYEHPHEISAEFLSSDASNSPAAQALRDSFLAAPAPAP